MEEREDSETRIFRSYEIKRRIPFKPKYPNKENDQPKAEIRNMKDI